MIINIPLNIPEELLENTIAKDYESKITENLTNEVRKIIANHDDSYYYNTGKDFHRGLERFVASRTDILLNEYKDEIIDAAAKYLGNRLLKTKRGKEILENLTKE